MKKVGIIMGSDSDLPVVEKAINMADMMNIKMLGLVENMSYVECDQCGNKMYVFGQSHIDEVAEKTGLPVLARIPLRPSHAEATDKGTIETLEQLQEMNNTMYHRGPDDAGNEETGRRNDPCILFR